jgi:hypothetical protein
VARAPPPAKGVRLPKVRRAAEPWPVARAMRFSLCGEVHTRKPDWRRGCPLRSLQEPALSAVEKWESSKPRFIYHTLSSPV